MADNKDGHREYAAGRKASVIRLTDDLRGSDSLLKEFASNPGEVTSKYGLKLTEEEVASLSTLVASGELNEAALSSVAGGDIIINFWCQVDP